MKTADSLKTEFIKSKKYWLVEKCAVNGLRKTQSIEKMRK